MRLTPLFSFGLPCALLVAAGCASPRPVGEMDRTTFVRDALAPYVERGTVPGVISILRKGETEDMCCLGFADVARTRPLTLDTPFMQCSQTKGFCGVTVARLVEEGRLGLDDPVSRYLPEFAEQWVVQPETNGQRRLVRTRTPVTVRMCLNHTAGFPFELPNYEAMGGWSRRMPLRSVAALAAALPLDAEPGAEAGYSNVGIDVAAAVVEVVTCERWEDYLKRVVLDPLEMRDTGFWPTDEQLAARFELFSCHAGGPATRCAGHPAMQAPYNGDRVFPSAGAGLWTTARDQLKFYTMLMNLGAGPNGVRILKEETVRNLLARSTRPPNLANPDYSLGLRAPLADADDKWFGHGGAWGTQCMVNWHRKELNLWVVQAAMGDALPEFDKEHDRAVKLFFEHDTRRAEASEYTGRMK